MDHFDVDAAFNPELRKQEAEFALYLENRPEHNESAYFDEQRQIAEQSSHDSYEDLSITALARVITIAELNEDKTTEQNAGEELLLRIGSMAASEQVFDRMLAYKESFKEKLLSNGEWFPGKLQRVADIADLEIAAPLSAEEIKHQEDVLCIAMLGEAKVSAIDPRRVKDKEALNFSEANFEKLINKFRENPKDSMAPAREMLFELGRNKDYSKAELDYLLDTYLEAYFDLTLKLDHQAFPPTGESKVSRGVPDYMPDGFVDMGGEPSPDPAARRREMILVDKKNIFAKYKYLLKDIFTSEEFADLPLQERKEAMAKRISFELYKTMEYKNGNLGSDKVPLSEISETVCRHHALAFQALSQVVGLKTRILKNYVGYGDGVMGKHSANMLRINGSWYIFDVTSPEIYEGGDCKKYWAAAMYEVDAPPKGDETKVWSGPERHSKRERIYEAHNNSYWFIDSTDPYYTKD